MPKLADFHLSIEEYETLIEDLNDLASMVERRGEPVSEHAEVVSGLKADGLLQGRLASVKCIDGAVTLLDCGV